MPKQKNVSEPTEEHHITVDEVKKMIQEELENNSKSYLSEEEIKRLIEQATSEIEDKIFKANLREMLKPVFVFLIYITGIYFFWYGLHLWNNGWAFCFLGLMFLLSAIGIIANKE